MIDTSISIVGSGVVGTATGKGLAKHGYKVIFNDTSVDKLKDLDSEGYQTTRNISEAIASTSISFVCVQTPTLNNGAKALRFVEKAVARIAEALRKKTDYHVIVIRSTLLPGACRERIIPLLQKHSKSRLFEHYGLCYNPEFLRQNSALEDFLNPSRIVIGEANRKSGDALETVYSRFGCPIVRTDFDTAEMIKIVSNAFLATKISFFNEMHMICRRLGVDDKLVSEAVSLDPRIGKYGIYGGRPFLGRCLPNDVKAFAKFIKKLDLNPDIIRTVIAINNSIKANTP